MHITEREGKEKNRKGPVTHVMCHVHVCGHACMVCFSEQSREYKPEGRNSLKKAELCVEKVRERKGRKEGF